MPGQGRRALIASLVAIAVLALVVVLSNAMISGRRPAAAPATPVPSSLPAIASPSQSAIPVSSPAADPSSDPPKPVVTITAVGDLELGNTPDLPADPAGYLSPVHAALAAPIVFGNLEGTLTNATSRKCPTPTPTPITSAPAASASPKPTATPKNPTPPASATPTKPPPPPTCFAFRTPPSYASVLRNAGFTVLNSANNHAHDFGSRGVSETSAALSAAHVAQTGLPGQVAVVNANGARIAVIGFAPYAGANNLLDTTRARQLISTAKHDTGLVVVYMHAGAEGSAATHVTGEEEHYLGEDRGDPQQFAHMAIDAGADLVLGSGPHVLRGMEYYRGHLIAYSLGDFAGYHNFATTGTLALSGILRVSLTADGRPAVAHFTSVRLNSSGRPAVDPGNAAAGLVNQLSAADFGGNAAVITPSGDIAPA